MFLHDFHPQSIIVEFGWLKLRWYGLIIVLATIAGLELVTRLNKKYQKLNISIFKNRDQIFDLYFYLVIFGLIGARVYEVFLFLPVYLADPLSVFAVWQGGLAIHGAIIAGAITLFLFVKKNQLNLFLVADVVAPAVALGQVVGRWGNYFNQELFGLPTLLPWGIPIDLANRPAGYENFNYFHPTFLYESVLNLLLCGLLVWLHYRRKQEIKKIINQKNNESKKQEISYGNIALIYFIGYSLIRFGLEFIKIDETPLILGWRWPQFISLVIIGVSVGLLVKVRKIKYKCF